MSNDFKRKLDAYENGELSDSELEEFEKELEKLEKYQEYLEENKPEEAKGSTSNEKSSKRY